MSTKKAKKTAIIETAQESSVEQASIKILNTYLKNVKNCKELYCSINEYAERYCKVNNHMPEFSVGIFEHKFDEIVELLDPKSPMYNKKLISNIENKEIKYGDLPYLEAWEIFPENWEEIIKTNQYREYKQNNLASTNIYTCKNCGCKQHRVSQMQTRSADEPMTTFVTCQKCPTTFKF